MSTTHRMKLAALAGLLLLAAAGCHKATFVDPAVPEAKQAPIEKWNNFYLFGLVGEQELDVRRYCQHEAASVRTGGNVGTDALTIVTLGIYAPRKVYITCADRPYQPATAQGETTTQIASAQGPEVLR